MDTARLGSRCALRTLACGVLRSLLAAGVLAFPARAQDPAADPNAGAAPAEAAEEAAAPAVPAPAPDLEEFVVLGSPVEQMIQASREEADELLNTLSAAELSKFAASDVADALKFVPGVNVVKGQFAIIRGLEDRYSSTLYNSAPIPSPDPDSQSVQLDLFPSDVVSNLVVAKTFGAELPSNSSGGSINILTQEYPEEFEIKFSPGIGFNENAADRFLELTHFSTVGKEIDGEDTLESDFAFSVGGTREGDRELRFKAAFAREIDYETAEGFQQGREPRNLVQGNLVLTDGRFDLTESERAEQTTGYVGLGLSLDREGDHNIDASYFYTDKEEQVVQSASNGYFPGYDYNRLRQAELDGQEPTRDMVNVATLSSWLADFRSQSSDFPSRGHVWYANLNESSSYDRDRDLRVYQVNGDHHIAPIEGLHFAWAANKARTTQEDVAYGAQYFYEPVNKDVSQIPAAFPATAEALGDGDYWVNGGIVANDNDVEETQDFARLDGDYEFDLTDFATLKLDAGRWYERADRDVDSSFLQSPTREGMSQYADTSPTEEGIGRQSLLGLDQLNGVFSGTRLTTTEGSREIDAWSFGGKATLWEQVDLLASLRLEDIFIESVNDAFTGDLAFDGTPAIFPTKYLFCDRLDNPARNETEPKPGTVFNDELLGLNVSIDPTTGFVDLVDRAAIEQCLNGEIDESRSLPSLGLAYRPIEGLALRGAYSQTVARPSFREIGYYASVEPATSDVTVGNPQLELSDVDSWDLRGEYMWGDRGEIAAISLFYKKIQQPIESISIRDPTNLDALSGALFRTFFNNPNEATLQGIELEGRKNLGFIPLPFLEYFTLGGNFTYIDAEVDRTQAELLRSTRFFNFRPGQAVRFTHLEESRRLFGQPEWIANVDFGFEQPDWGTRITLVWFSISDILDAAGTASTAPNGDIVAFTLDRYVGSYGQLDLVMSQKWRDFTFKFSVKNLTDSERSIIYDPEQTAHTIEERAYRIGRDYSASITYQIPF
jgi:outer membrane receptor protein involved in Fe transport